MTDLFTTWEDVPLYSAKDCPPNVVQLPRQTYGKDEPPPLVKVRKAKGSAPRIAATGWWGKADYPPESNSVHVAPGLHQNILGSAADGTIAQLERASRFDAVRYARGFGVRALWAVLVAAVAIAGAVAGFVTSNAPAGLALAALALVCVSAVVNAGITIYKATRP